MPSKSNGTEARMPKEAKQLREPQEKSVQFISKLVQLTQDGRIEWVPTSSPRDKERAAFVAEVEGRRLRIYSYAQEVEATAFVTVFGINAGSGPRLVLRPVLEVLDDLGRVVFSFEGRAGISDLYESAAYSASKVEDLIETVLAKS